MTFKINKRCYTLILKLNYDLKMIYEITTNTTNLFIIRN